MSTDDRPTSDAAQPENEATVDTHPGAESGATARSRNAVEKVAVWSLILGLCALAGCEAAARFGHQRSIEAVDEAYRSSLNRVSEFLVSDAFQADVQAKVEEGMSADGAAAAVAAKAIRDNPDQGRGLTLAEAEELMSGFPQKSVEPVTPYIHDVTYRWKTLLKNYGGIRIRYQIESGEVLKVTDFVAGAES